jgi:hypothetical protein
VTSLDRSAEPPILSPRRRFQFRLRTVFVVVTIVAVQCAACVPTLKEWQRLQQVRGQRLEAVGRLLAATMSVNSMNSNLLLELHSHSAPGSQSITPETSSSVAPAPRSGG